MKYSKLENSDLNISRIILGTWAIGGDYWGEYNEHEAVKTIECAIDNGLNTIDTAPAYGAGYAEELIGKIVSGKREKVIIASKCGLNIYDGYKKNLSKEYLEKDLDQSLKRLQTDYIDLYQCHWPDSKTPIEETMAVLENFIKKGKIRYAGVCNFPPELIEESLNNLNIISIQPHYSLLERTIENDGTKQTAVANSLSILPYGSLGGGMLTGKYSERPKFKRADARSFFYKFFKETQWEKADKLVKEMKKVSDRYGCNPSHVAIAWLLKQEGVAGTIVGAKNPQQVLDNNRAVDIDLADEDVVLLNELSVP